MARWAVSLGLIATTAANADEALASLRTQTCDLAVIDIRMPGRDGLWLADALRREHPGTAVVIATAYTALFDSSPDAPPVADLLVKPFARDRFAMAVERGRQWRKDTLEELSWQGRLTQGLRDRIAEVCVEVGRRSEAGARESNVLHAAARARTPET